MRRRTVSRGHIGSLSVPALTDGAAGERLRAWICAGGGHFFWKVSWKLTLWVPTALT